MRKNRLVVQILVTVFMVSCLGTAGAAESVMTVFPKGVVKVTENNGQVVQLTTNFPLKEGAIMEVSGGPATVQGANFSIIAQDKARFSFNNAGGKLVCTVYSGKVNYVLHSDAKVKFAHGDAVYDCQKISPATPGGSVEGSAAVVGDSLVFIDTSGELVCGPIVAGVEGAPLVVDPAGAGGISAAPIVPGAFVAGVAAYGTAMGLSSGKDGASQ
ncbi:MAG: hypothetical protein ACLQBD_07820 [Syntrophobacteraceae bacterium]